ncbi:MAG TPA: 1-acylglycerol-3-phosphate O-acyltransferase [Solirubrobacteraceae bacterium]
MNPFVYWLTRAVLQPFFHLYFRLGRIGRDHIPADGPLIIAANHRSFLDPFVIGTLLRRPVYFMAKKELFANRLQAWFLNSLGAFPIDRGNADGGAMATAREILERGDVVVVFPEGTRIRPGGLGKPKRGVGRLALETGAPVVPVSVIGTESIRRGWRVRPHKVRIRVGRPLRFPRVDQPSPELARAVTDRIWPCVALQWEWLGGLPPIRRAAVIGERGADLAIALARAGVDVEMGCAGAAAAADLRATRRVGAFELPKSVGVSSATDLELTGHDLVCLSVPAVELTAVVAELGPRIPRRAGVLITTHGPVDAKGVLPAHHLSGHCDARAVATLGAAAGLVPGAPVVVASRDAGFARQVADLLSDAGLAAQRTTDVAGVELAMATLGEGVPSAPSRQVA